MGAWSDVVVIIYQNQLEFFDLLSNFPGIDFNKNTYFFAILFDRVWHFAVFIAIALYVGMTIKRPRNYVSLLGILILILLGIIGKSHRLFSSSEASCFSLGSKYPQRIRWRTVFYSFVIQFLLATVVIHLEVGFQFFNFLGKIVSKFIQ